MEHHKMLHVNGSNRFNDALGEPTIARGLSEPRRQASRVVGPNSPGGGTIKRDGHSSNNGHHQHNGFARARAAHAASAASAPSSALQARSLQRRLPLGAPTARPRQPLHHRRACSLEGEGEGAAVADGQPPTPRTRRNSEQAHYSSSSLSRSASSPSALSSLAARQQRQQPPPAGTSGRGEGKIQGLLSSSLPPPPTPSQPPLSPSLSLLTELASGLQAVANTATSVSIAPTAAESTSAKGESLQSQPPASSSSSPPPLLTALQDALGALRLAFRERRCRQQREGRGSGGNGSTFALTTLLPLYERIRTIISHFPLAVVATLPVDDDGYDEDRHHSDSRDGVNGDNHPPSTTSMKSPLHVPPGPAGSASSLPSLSLVGVPAHFRTAAHLLDTMGRAIQTAHLSLVDLLTARFERWLQFLLSATTPGGTSPPSPPQPLSSTLLRRTTKTAAASECLAHYAPDACVEIPTSLLLRNIATIAAEAAAAAATTTRRRTTTAVTTAATRVEEEAIGLEEESATDSLRLGAVLAFDAVAGALFVEAFVVEAPPLALPSPPTTPLAAATRAAPASPTASPPLAPPEEEEWQKRSGSGSSAGGGGGGVLLCRGGDGRGEWVKLGAVLWSVNGVVVAGRTSAAHLEATVVEAATLPPPAVTTAAMPPTMTPVEEAGRAETAAVATATAVKRIEEEGARKGREVCCRCVFTHLPVAVTAATAAASAGAAAATTTTTAAVVRALISWRTGSSNSGAGDGGGDDGGVFADDHGRGGGGGGGGGKSSSGTSPSSDTTSLSVRSFSPRRAHDRSGSIDYADGSKRRGSVHDGNGHSIQGAVARAGGESSSSSSSSSSRGVRAIGVKVRPIAKNKFRELRRGEAGEGRDNTQDRRSSRESATRGLGV